MPKREAITRYFGTLDGGPGAQRAVVEPTSAWYWLRDLLVGQGVDLRLGHSKHVEAISYAKVKTDAVDATTLAQLLRSDRVPEAHTVSADWHEARDLLRARLQIVRQQVRCTNAIVGPLTQYNVTAPAALPPLVLLRVRLLEEQLTLLGAQAKQLAAELNPVLIPNPDVQRLLWLPEMGRVVAFTIYLEVDGTGRFRSARAFVSYCRLVPGAVAPESCARVHITAGDARLNPTAAERASCRGEVVRLVRVELSRATARPARLPPHRRDGIEEDGEDGDLVPVPRGDQFGERDALAVREEAALPRGARMIRRVRAGLSPLCFTPFARTSEASMTARLQSRHPAPSSRARMSCWSRSKPQARCQSRSRRQQVMPEPRPISWGRASHWMPVLSTKTMPVKQARSGVGADHPSGEAGGAAGAARREPRAHQTQEAQPCRLRLARTGSVRRS